MAEELPDLVTAEEGTLVLVFAAADGGGGGGGGVCHGRNWPFGLSWVFIIFGTLLLLFSSLFWGCSWLTIRHSLAQVCFGGVGCEFGLKYRPIK